MVAAGGKDRETLYLHRDPPIQPYFERQSETDTVICLMGQTLLYFGPGWPNGKKHDECRRYHRLSACLKCPNKCTTAKRRCISFKPGESRIYTDFYDKCMRYYPNQRRLRIRNQVVEHPFGTVKRWNDGYHFLVKGRVKAAAEIALAYLGYNFKRVLNLLGIVKMMTMITA